MKILFCSPVIPSTELGVSKVLVELVEELQELGWACQLLSSTEVCAGIEMFTGIKYQRLYTQSLQSYLHEHASKYDVVDYDHLYLPYSRAEFSPSTLFVARSALLVHHLQTFPIPLPANWRGKIGQLIKGRSRQAQLQEWISNATVTVREADLVNVNNEDAKLELIERGISAAKIVVLPLGISRTRRILFSAVSSKLPPQPIVAFIGTFDPRKGANALPEIVQQISNAVPQVGFRLLGTRNKTEKEVLSQFPSHLNSRIEVIAYFDSVKLPRLLASCSVGIFPSYLEGFGLGVLEMLAASIPVIAYQAPGPPMMLPPEYLVPRGDFKSMSQKVINLLQDEEKLKAARQWAKQQSQQFCWQNIAQATSERYLHFLELKRAAQPK